jgi:uncharacterized protein YbjT (DUF2867 family)
MLLVTGTSGALGGAIASRLAGRDGVLRGSRTAAGPGARRVDFDRPETLPAAFEGVDVLLLVSAGYAEDDVVRARHGAVVDAAADAGVRHVVYTSLAGAADRLTIALAHRWTEARLAAAPFDVTILRNGLYAEVPVALAAGFFEQPDGVFAAPWGDGAVSVVHREDLADVAARVVVEAHDDALAGRASRHAGRVYELAGDALLTGSGVAALVGDRYQEASLGGAWGALADGVPPYQVAHAVSIFSALGAGLLAREPEDADHLAELLGRPARPVTDVVRAVLAPQLSK